MVTTLEVRGRGRTDVTGLRFPIPRTSLPSRDTGHISSRPKEYRLRLKFDPFTRSGSLREMTACGVVSRNLTDTRLVPTPYHDETTRSKRRPGPPDSRSVLETDVSRERRRGLRDIVINMWLVSFQSLLTKYLIPTGGEGTGCTTRKDRRSMNKHNLCLWGVPDNTGCRVSVSLRLSSRQTWVSPGRQTVTLQKGQPTLRRPTRRPLQTFRVLRNPEVPLGSYMVTAPKLFLVFVKVYPSSHLVFHKKDPTSDPLSVTLLTRLPCLVTSWVQWTLPPVSRLP